MTRPRKPSLTNLRKLRLSEGLTQLQLASAADISLNTVWKIENATDHDELLRVDTWTWRLLAQVLKVGVRDIYPNIGI